MNLDPVELTRTLIRCDTVNPPGNERRCAEILSRLLEPQGFAVETSEFAAGRSTLVAELGLGKGLPICLTGHLDTVPLGSASWGHDPFVADIEGDRLFGRGSSDMKSGIAAMVSAVCELAPMIRGGSGPGVVLVLTAGEETGCEGAFHLVRDLRFKTQMGALLVGEPTANVPLVGHKGALWLRASTTGITAHGSTPDKGVNAIYPLVTAVDRVQRYPFETGRHPAMGAPTLNVGTIRGGLNVNSVPDSASADIDIRTVAGMEHDSLLISIGRYLGDAVRLEPFLNLDAVYTDPANPWVSRVVELVAEITGKALTPGTADFFSDASALQAPLGQPPTVILGPGEPHMAHRTDEYCRISRIQEATDIYIRVLRDWCRL